MAQPFLYAIYPVPTTNALQLAVETSKASSRRNAEVIMVQEITRWRSEVERFAPARLVEFEDGITQALAHPAPLPQRDEGKP